MFGFFKHIYIYTYCNVDFLLRECDHLCGSDRKISPVDMLLHYKNLEVYYLLTYLFFLQPVTDPVGCICVYV